ncbi:MAG: DUF6600 domain-containing protein [bacterium]
MKKQIFMVLALVAGLFLAWSARAEDGVKGPVPWVSDIEGGSGSLLVKQQDTDWFEATVNTPLGRGDMLWQKPGGHSEVYFDDGSWVRLGGKTGLEFAELEDGRVRLIQTRGRALLSNSGRGEFLVDLPGQTMSLPPGSRARLAVDEDGNSRVVVKEGKAYVTGPEGRVRVNQGQTLRADPEGHILKLTRADSSRGLDRYSRERSRELGRGGGPPTTTVAYMPDPVVHQMSVHGTWVNTPGYGWVWRPSVSASWAPYREGRWMYRSGWGWTWISYEPWGWYPYHHGRWVVVNNNWVWAPMHVRGRWYPSLVFWVEGPDYIAWHPIPYGVSVSVVHTWGPSTARRYVRHRGVTVIHHRHFSSCNYHRYVRPWNSVSHRSVRVIHHPHHARHHSISVRHHHTPRTNGYIHKGRAPSSRAVYAHKRHSSREKTARVHYGNRTGSRTHPSASRDTTVRGHNPRRDSDRSAGRSTSRPSTPRAGNRAGPGKANGRHYGHSSDKTRGRSSVHSKAARDADRPGNKGSRARGGNSASRSRPDKSINYGADRPRVNKGRAPGTSPGHHDGGRSLNKRGNSSGRRDISPGSPSRHGSSRGKGTINKRSQPEKGSSSSHIFSSGKKSKSSSGSRSYSAPSRKSSHSSSHRSSKSSRSSGGKSSGSHHKRHR